MKRHFRLIEMTFVIVMIIFATAIGYSYLHCNSDKREYVNEVTEIKTEARYKIDFLDLHNEVLERHVVAYGNYWENDYGIKVFTDNKPRGILEIGSFVVWHGSYKVTRLEVPISELEKQ